MIYVVYWVVSEGDSEVQHRARYFRSREGAEKFGQELIAHGEFLRTKVTTFIYEEMLGD